MTSREYKNSLEKLLKNLFKRANTPMITNDNRDELKLVIAIIKVHQEIKKYNETQQAHLNSEVCELISKGLEKAITNCHHLDW